MENWDEKLANDRADYSASVFDTIRSKHKPKKRNASALLLAGGRTCD
jgi:hypothetical protein